MVGPWNPQKTTVLSRNKVPADSRKYNKPGNRLRELFICFVDLFHLAQEYCIAHVLYYTRFCVVFSMVSSIVISFLASRR